MLGRKTEGTEPMRNAHGKPPLTLWRKEKQRSKRTLLHQGHPKSFLGRRGGPWGQSLNEMLPSAGVYYFPWEINSSVPEGKTLRTFGRLCCYDLARSEAVLTTQHNSAQYQVCVDTKFVEPFQAQVGSFYMVLGEAEHREETSSPVVKARILTCVEGMNVPLLEQAIQEQRKYFNERQEQRGNSTS
ncbi:CST complex subunit TEN1 isoform X1 [Parus major]|uniref:CST complex subunit TEN1 isoform X1 n=2 Tax=Parus major TaxID=9157 RepID=UPI0007715200|nr:CST complex subunit TEN1 isoform X1 [Parus major]